MSMGVNEQRELFALHAQRGGGRTRYRGWLAGSRSSGSTLLTMRTALGT